MLTANTPPHPMLRLPIRTHEVPIWIMALVALVFALKWLEDVLIPLLLSVLISYVLEPAVAWLARRRLPRPLGAALILTIIVSGLGYGAYQLRNEAEALLEQVPAAAHKVVRALRQHGAHGPGSIAKVEKAASELEQAANVAPAAPPRGVTKVQIVQPPLSLRAYLWWGSMSAVAVLAEAALILFLVYFILASGDLYKRKLLKLAGPSLAKKRITLQILREIHMQIQRFLYVQIVTSAMAGVATWLVFRLLDLRHAGIWGVLAGLLHSIPYFGPGFITLGAAVVGFLQTGVIATALLAAGLLLVISTLIGFVIAPWLTSRAARMNAVAVFVGLLFWGWLWGLWGLLLAIPIMMMIKAAADRLEGFKAVGELMGE